MSRWDDHRAELRRALHDRMIDHDRVFSRDTENATGDHTPALTVRDAIEVAIDYFTDGDESSFFNHCPACDCLCSGDANRSDCGCWCHSPDEGWRARQAEIDALRLAIRQLHGFVIDRPDADWMPVQDCLMDPDAIDAASRAYTETPS